MSLHTVGAHPGPSLQLVNLCWTLLVCLLPAVVPAWVTGDGKLGAFMHLANYAMPCHGGNSSLTPAAEHLCPGAQDGHAL